MAQPHRGEIAFFFEAVQQGVKSSGADVVAMASEFARHRQAKDGAFDRVVKDVQANQARVEVAVIHLGLFGYRHSIAYIDIMRLGHGQVSTISMDLTAQLVETKKTFNTEGTETQSARRKWRYVLAERRMKAKGAKRHQRRDTNGGA